MNSKALGTVFEKRVMSKLEGLGFECWRDLYVPFDRYPYQVDVFAMRKDMLLCVECKNWTGAYDPVTHKWYRDGKIKVFDVAEQVDNHALAMLIHLNVQPTPVVVVNDGLRILRPNPRFVHLRELERFCAPVPAVDYTSMFEDIRHYAEAWTHVSESVKEKHLAHAIEVSEREKDNDKN